jgi:hypothetical protein
MGWLSLMPRKGGRAGASSLPVVQPSTSTVLQHPLPTQGGVIRDAVLVQWEARQVVDEWLKERQDHSPARCLPRTGRQLSRREAYGIIQRLVAQAHASLPEDEQMEVSPLVLRHIFLRKRAETKGVQYAREASGH